MGEHRSRSNEGPKGRPTLFIERRHATRFAAQLPVVVRWRDGSELREAFTESEDVSTKGIYFVLAEDIKEGTTVEVQVTLPNQITFEQEVKICCLGHVLRSELEGTKTGVAAVIETYRFLSDGIPTETLL